jgi:predicted transcriptional regulator
MGEVLKRHKPSAVRAGKVALPRSLQILRQLNFVALLERPNSGKRSWRVELSSKTAKCLINASNELQQFKKQHGDLTLQHSSLTMKFAELQERSQRLEHNNRKLMENIEADKRPEKGTHPKSQKSYLNIAEEKSMKVKGSPVQGGLPSLGKRS